MNKLYIFITVFLIVSFIFSFCPSASATAPNPDTYFITSKCTDNYLELNINGNELNINGVLSYSRNFWALISVGDNSIKVSVTPGVKFIAKLTLNNINKKTAFTVYTGSDEYGSFKGYIWHSIYIAPDGNGGYLFFKSPVFDNNLALESQWSNPGDYISDTIDESVQELSNKLTAGVESNYEKVRLLYDWVVDNICYDYDVYYGTGTRIVSSSGVLESKRSVCQGYTNLLRDLIQVQKIPCMIVSTYSLGISTSGEWTDEYASVTDSNHAHNEAFIDGRWVIMDATWDSRNVYKNGVYNYNESNCYFYFDITNAALAGNHKIIKRVSTSSDDTPSSWAQDEILSAFCNNLVPDEIQNKYRNNITREEFCNLIINMICIKNRISLSEYLQKAGVIINASVFTDTSDEAVLAANALGIVNGRGKGIFDPIASISRQEAAAMLQRCASIMNLNGANGKAIIFNDSNTFATWAVDAIKFVSSMLSSDGIAIMGGTGDNQFSPFNDYTREQSILTVLRLYNCQ